MNALVIFAIVAQTRTLTIHEAVNTTLRTHPAVAFADANHARSGFAVRELDATRRPQLSMDASATRFQKAMVVAPLHAFDPRNPPVFDEMLGQGSLTLGYTLFDASRGDRIARAQAMADAAGAQADGARAQVISETVRTYLRANSVREIAAAQEKQVVALQRERDRAAQLVEQGKAARVVLLRAEAALSAARADAVTAASELDVAQQDLARLLGVDAAEVAQSRLTPVASRATEIDRANLLASAEQKNADLRRLRLQTTAAQSERNAAQGTWWPRVQLAGRFVEYASSATSPQGEWQGGAAVSYPIYTGGARNAAIDRASAETRAADAELALGRRRVAEAIDRALTAVKSAAARVAALDAAVTQSEEVTRIDRLALEAGAGVQMDYLTAEANLLRVRAALTDARASEVLARVELARISGELTPEWLSAHLENVP
jgi:outer membrane protein